MRAGLRAMRAEEDLLRIAQQLQDSARKLIEIAAVHEDAAGDLKDAAQARVAEEEQ